MLDDVGFGASSPFGGPVSTPSLQRLADAGLRYNRFHTAAMCSPTRAALLTGRNHHGLAAAALAGRRLRMLASSPTSFRWTVGRQ